MFDTNNWINLDLTMVQAYGYIWDGWFYTLTGNTSRVITGVDRVVSLNTPSHPLFNYNYFVTLRTAGAIPDDCYKIIDTGNIDYQLDRHFQDEAVRGVENFDLHLR